MKIGSLHLSVQSFQRGVTWICLLISLLVLFGWFTDQQAILSIIPGGATMKFNTALVFFLSGLSLQFPKSKLNKLFSGLIVLLGTLTLMTYLGLDFQWLDNLFVQDEFSSKAPGRMSPATAICATLVGLGLFGIRASNKVLLKASTYSLKFVILISLTAIIAYILMIPVELKISFFQSMAIHTSVLFLLISLSLLLNSSESHLNKVLRSQFQGSRIFRRLLPLILVLPVLSGFIVLEGVNKEAINLESGVVILVTISIPIILIYITYVAIGLNRSEAEREELSRNLKHSNKVLSQFKKGLDEVSLVSLTDRNGNITYVNDAFCEISKYSREELIGASHNIISSGAHPKSFYQEMWKTISGGQIWSGDIKNKAKDGSFFWIERAIIPFFNNKGEIKEYLGIGQDLTQRKEAEELLKSEYVKTLEFKNKELEQFAYITSHDLKEPLRTIISFAKLIKDRRGDSFDEFEQKSMQFIMEATERMSDLISSLLDYSQVDKNNQLTTFDCNEVIKVILHDLSQKIKDKKAEITYDKLPQIEGYQTPLRLLLQNLISNALKFTSEGVIPKIHINCSDNESTWQFSVQDNGIGIKKEYQERIFKIFQKLHSRSEYEGTGIGLAHCLKVVELHGGKIWVESEKGKGSTFHFTLSKSLSESKGIAK